MYCVPLEKYNEWITKAWDEISKKNFKNVKYRAIYVEMKIITYE